MSDDWYIYMNIFCKGWQMKYFWLANININ